MDIYMVTMKRTDLNLGAGSPSSVTDRRAGG